MSDDKKATSFDDVGELMMVMEGGKFQADLNDKFAEFLDKLRHAAWGHEKGKAKGDLTIKISADLTGGYIAWVGDVTMKTPKIKREATGTFLLPEGGLSPYNPEQLDLYNKPVRTMDDPAPRTVEDNEGDTPGHLRAVPD